MTATFTGPFTESETAALTQATVPFAAPWCFSKEAQGRSFTFQGWQPCWDGVTVGRRSAPPFKAKTVTGLVARIGLLAAGKMITKKGKETGEL